MNITELKELAEKATPGPWVAGDDEDSDYFLVGPCGDDGIVYQSVVKLHSEINADYIAAANPAAILELIANLEDAQGEIRALRATEAGLRERVKELEKELNRKSEVFTPLDPWSVEQDYYGWLTTSSTTWDAYLAGVRLAESAHLKHAIDAHARALLEKKE